MYMLMQVGLDFKVERQGSYLIDSIESMKIGDWCWKFTKRGSCRSLIPLGH